MIERRLTPEDRKRQEEIKRRYRDLHIRSVQHSTLMFLIAAVVTLAGFLLVPILPCLLPVLAVAIILAGFFGLAALYEWVGLLLED